jgi:hypothetical protein
MLRSAEQTSAKQENTEAHKSNDQAQGGAAA